MNAMSQASNLKLSNIAIVLVHPQIPENIGACARAMNNMGLSRLIVVKPDNCDLKRVVRMATGSSIDIIQEMEYVEDFPTAIGPFQYIVGTTARIGARRPAILYPRELAQDLIDLSQHNRIAILFGPEDRGLSNEHLRHCHTIATIPTVDFSSLNLAHAVLIFCYELALRSREAPEKFIPRLADKFEQEHMYEHLRDALLKIGFINPENPEHWMLNIRRFLARYHLRGREVKIIRGICRQIDWYTGQLEKFKRKDLESRAERKGAEGPRDQGVEGKKQDKKQGSRDRGAKEKLTNPTPKPRKRGVKISE
jgi:tRNA/rRNA methyltransferase